MSKLKSIFYKGTSIKRAGVSIEYTPEQINEIIKCKKDPIYFIRNYCKIVSLDQGLINFNLYQCQEKVVHTIFNNRKVISMMPRQVGKTTLSAAVLLHYVLFNPDYTIAIVAHKAGGAREVLDRIQKMYELLPFWMMQGVTVWNKGDIKLENGSRVITGATTSSGLRGKSCVTGDTKICILSDNRIYYTEIDKIINKSEFVDIKVSMFKYTVYKTTNKIDGKIYVGFHQVPSDNIILDKTETGSIYKDGYLGSGKHLIRAIEKYGVENFKQDLLGSFDDIDSALNMERNIVDKEFTLRDDTYNICEGGNVRIMHGKNNPFHGKTHSKETIEKIRKTREESGKPTYQSKIINNITKEIYLGVSDAVNKLGLELNEDKLLILDKLCYEGTITFFREENQRCAIDRYEKFLEIEKNKPLLKERQAILCRERFKGKKQSDDTIKKRSYKVKEWIKENPEKHTERMLKINKNPDKIRKTAETHRGMKRSEEACMNIKNACQGRVSNIKGKISAYNTKTNEIKFFDTIEDIPEDYKRGMPKRKNRGTLFNNGIEQKFFKDINDIPEGWIIGGLPKPRKNK